MSGWFGYMGARFFKRNAAKILMTFRQIDGPFKSDLLPNLAEVQYEPRPKETFEDRRASILREI
jgi:hypothetical protein